MTIDAAPLTVVGPSLGIGALPPNKWMQLTTQLGTRRAKRRATIRLSDGTERTAELHWYEAAGIGRKEYKIKRYLD